MIKTFEDLVKYVFPPEQCVKSSMGCGRIDNLQTVLACNFHSMIDCPYFFVRASRYLHSEPSLMHKSHCGRRSSHFAFRDRHISQACEFQLRMPSYRTAKAELSLTKTAMLSQSLARLWPVLADMTISYLISLEGTSRTQQLCHGFNSLW